MPMHEQPQSWPVIRVSTRNPHDRLYLNLTAEAAVISFKINESPQQRLFDRLKKTKLTPDQIEEFISRVFPQPKEQPPNPEIPKTTVG